MPRTIGTINPFNEAEEDFDSYCSRVDLYFVANEIENEKKVASFLTLGGPKIFGLAKNLLSPKSPASCSYKEIQDALKAHYKPKLIVIYERFKFYSRSQKSGESVADFLAALKALAHTCNFGTTLSDMLRDRFVMGLSNGTTQQHLLAEPDLNFNKAVDMATAREAALRDVKAMGGEPVHKVHSQSKLGKAGISSSKNIHSGGKFTSKPSSSNNSKGSDAKPKMPCTGCGNFHWKKDCPFRNAECHTCKKKGHIKKMCFESRSDKTQPKSNVHFSSSDRHSPTQPPNSDSDPCYDFIFSVNSDRVDPILVDVVLNKVRVSMELDTGAACSLMPRSKYEQLWPVISERPILSSSSTMLRVYGGSTLKVFGEIVVTARLEDKSQSCSAKVIIVDDEGPCLLGRDLIQSLGLYSDIHQVSNANSFKAEFPELFSEGLGCYQGRDFTIEVDQSVPPKYCKARPVPYTMREKVEEELVRLEEEGIISPVTSSSWAAAVVPVLKPDGKIRLCGDYKLTVNRAARLDTYPIPTLDDLFSRLSGGSVFSKLDMSQAYAQLCLDEESKQYTVINTHRGLFRYNRLSFGISSAPGIFQRAMEELLRDMPGVLCYLDDILIAGSTEEEHNQRLRKVLEALQSAGLKLSLAKCSFGVPYVSYLGFLIDKQGIHPTQEKVQAISEAPAPTNVTQLRAYLGLLNFYRRFLPQAATKLEPLNRLLKANTPWRWGKEQESAFSETKKALLNSEALLHFDPKLPLVVVADSSAYGIGAVLCHLVDGVERPIYFASRTLTATERNYAQLEKEALAIVFALRKFHYYLWGQRDFTVITDHKPLLGIFSPDRSIPQMASGRIQRWALLLQGYNFTFRHRSGALLGTADALSRLPLTGTTTDSTPVPADWTFLVNFLDSSPVTSVDVKEHTRKDPILSKVLRFCETGWPTKNLGDHDFTPYVRRRDELSLQNGCVLWGSRVVIPPKLRSSLLGELHAGHFGSTRMKELSRSYFWWPNLDRDLEDVTNSCPECLSQRALPNKAELHPWEWPTHPWHRIHVDYAGPVDGRYFLVVVDAHSKWVDIYTTSGTTAKETIKCLQHSFSTFGLPVSIVSDNGPCFTSQEFKDFAKNSVIRLITTAVYKPSTNGLAERMVQTLKRALRTSTSPIQLTLDKFLFNYRLTPHSTTGVSPAELMFGRRLRSRLDLLWPTDTVSARVAERQQAQRRGHIGTPRTVKFSPEAPVMIRNYSQRGDKWIPSTIKEQTGPLSYRCVLPTGSVVKRHQDQILSRNIPSPKSPAHVISPPTEDATSPIRIFPPNEPTPSPDQISTPSTSGEGSVVQSSPTVCLRRSSRPRRPVERLDL